MSRRPVLPFLLLLGFLGCSSAPIPEELPYGLEIREKKQSKWTALTKQNLIHLAQVYNLKPFLYTKKIRIVPNEPSHSHPVLTINTRFAEQPRKLLATLLHEEFHWWVAKKKSSYKVARAQLGKLFPRPTVYRNNLEGTYEHLVVCYLELRALTVFLGPQEARKTVIELMSKDKTYPWIYSQVLTKHELLKKIVESAKLVPKF